MGRSLNEKRSYGQRSESNQGLHGKLQLRTDPRGGGAASEWVCERTGGSGKINFAGREIGLNFDE
jgi:hypothetical protein